MKIYLAPTKDTDLNNDEIQYLYSSLNTKMFHTHFLSNPAFTHILREVNIKWGFEADEREREKFT